MRVIQMFLFLIVFTWSGYSNCWSIAPGEPFPYPQKIHLYDVIKFTDPVVQNLYTKTNKKAVLQINEDLSKIGIRGLCNGCSARLVLPVNFSCHSPSICRDGSPFVEGILIKILKDDKLKFYRDREFHGEMGFLVQGNHDQGVYLKRQTLDFPIPLIDTEESEDTIPDFVYKIENIKRLWFSEKYNRWNGMIFVKRDKVAVTGICSDCYMDLHILKKKCIRKYYCTAEGRKFDRIVWKVLKNKINKFKKSLGKRTIVLDGRVILTKKSIMEHSLPLWYVSKVKSNSLFSPLSTYQDEIEDDIFSIGIKGNSFGEDKPYGSIEKGNGKWNY